MSSSSEREDVFSVVTASEDATLALAAALGRALAPGDTLGLTGDLGSGKTVFVRGLARGLGVPSGTPVCSPTFTLCNVYPIGSPDARESNDDLALYHLDLYRLSDEDELEAIGYRDYADGSGVVAVEWCDQVEGVLPEDHLRVALVVVDAERRALRFEATGPRSRMLVAALRGAAASLAD